MPVDPLLKCDFFVSAQLQSWEKPDEVALLYTGVLTMTLNQTVEVVFVPHTRRTERNWPPLLPENIDIIQTPEEARLVALGLAQYAVTPDAARAGQEECLPDPGCNLPEEGLFIPPSQSVIFYTTQPEYEQLSDEALIFVTYLPEHRLGIPVSEMKETFLREFLFRRILASPNFAPRHRQILERSGSK